MGATIKLDHGYVHAECKRLRGASIYLDMATVTGTENLMMAAALARGRTQLIGAAREPEIEELARVLNKMGARSTARAPTSSTSKASTRCTRSTTRSSPTASRPAPSSAPRRRRAATCSSRAPCPSTSSPCSARLRAAGVEIVREETGMRVRSAGARSLRSVDITTAPHPGFPTDMQAQFMAVMARAQGTSVVTESVFENRFMHVPELQRMGANIEVRGRAAVVSGVDAMEGATVMATDLRASACLVIAGLMAQGRTEVLRVYHLDRGYEAIEQKLRPLGARIERVRGDG
jgi:UDP-N-acetylglucosamine 1-carboxyvinyltransferase